MAEEAKKSSRPTTQKESRVGRAPRFIEAVSVVFVIIAFLVYSIIFLGVTAQISLSICLALSCVFALCLGHSWDRVEEMVMVGLRTGLLAMIINLMIGMLIAAWCAGGVVPYLVDLGLRFISPQYFLPATCIICCILSLCTGSSWTTAGTVGLALFGVGTAMGIPPAMIVGPILTGAYFGDKLSPISESTNCAAAAAETPLMEHVHSMTFVVIPSTLLAILIYGVMGWKYGNTMMDASSLTAMSAAFRTRFWMNPVLLVPLGVLGFCIYKRVSAIAAMGIAIMLGVVLALTQGFGFLEVTKALYSGLKIETGLKAVDSMLSRGGLNSMTGVITTIIVGMPLGGVLKGTDTLQVVVYHFGNFIKSVGNVVMGSVLSVMALSWLTGNTYGAYILTSAAFGTTYDDLEIDRKVLSRACEMGVVVLCLAPWTTGGVYMSNLFAMTTMDYAPYYIWGYIVPVFTIMCGYTGFGMFYTNGRRGWGKNKELPDPARVAAAIEARSGM